MKVEELFEAARGPNWKIQYQVRSKDADSLDSGSFVVNDYVDKERATAAGVSFLLKKFKGRDAKITRVTQLKEDLAEAYTPPVKNKKLGFRDKAKIPVGGTKEWLKAFGATQEHIDQAMRVIKQSQVVKRLAALGLHDESSDKHRKNGSIMFIGTMADGFPAIKPQVRRLKITVQPNGKMDETAPNDWHRAPIRTVKPHIVPGDPVGSIVKSMTAAMEKLEDIMQKRREKEKKLFLKK